MNTLKKQLGQIVKMYPHLVFLNILFLTTASFFETLSVVSLSPIIDYLMKPDLKQVSGVTQKFFEKMQDFGIPVDLKNIILVFLGMVLLKNVVSGGAKIFSIKFQFHLVLKKIFGDIFGSFLGAGLPFFIANHIGTLSSTLLKETDRIAAGFENISNIICFMLRMGFFLGLCFSLSWKLTLVVMTMGVIILIPFHLIGKLNYKLGQTYSNASNNLQKLIFETFSMPKTIIGYGNQDKAKNSLQKFLTPFISSASNLTVTVLLTPLVYEPLGHLVLFSSIFIGHIYLKLEFSEMLVVLYAIRTCMNLSLQIISEKNALLSVLPAMEQADRLVRLADSFAEVSGTVKINHFQKIKFENVAFSYSPDQPLILKNLNLEIQKGDVVGIVGESGSGKTTLTDIMMGLYKVERGSLTIDGIDIRELDINFWRRQIGFVPQDAVLFNGTLRENLLWANSEATNEEIMAACEKAYVMEFVNNFPDKLETHVGDRGATLSGGQRQRMALARAILRKPKILILDEATSALDGQSEDFIQKSIVRLSRTMTIIIVAHRFSTIKNADQIVMIHKGEVVERGNFDDLIQQRGRFFESFKMQIMTI